MENYSGGVNDNIGARAEAIGRHADLPKGFRNQAILGTAMVAAIIVAGWLFLASPSDRDVIEDRLARFGIPAAYVGEADGDTYLFTIDRECGDQITVTIDVGEPQTDGPRPVGINEDGTRSIRLSDSTTPLFLDCE